MNINKKGICNCNGAPNPNLIPGTSFKEVQYSYPSSGTSDYFTTLTSEVADKTQYILSFGAKSTVDGDTIRVLFCSPDTTTYSITSQGYGNTDADGLQMIVLSTEGEFYGVKYTQSTTTTQKTIIAPRMGMGHGDGVVSIKQMKLEEGDEPTIGVPNHTDEICPGIINGFIEHDDTIRFYKKDYIEAHDFIEM